MVLDLDVQTQEKLGGEGGSGGEGGGEGGGGGGGRRRGGGGRGGCAVHPLVWDTSMSSV